MTRNDGFEYRETVGEAAAGRRLVRHLAERWRHSSELEWRARIDEGRVLVDDDPAGPDTRLRRGQRLVWRRAGWIEPDAPRTFAVLHRDAELLAVAKPAGLPVLPGAGYLRATLLSLVRRVDAESSPAHRLGRWTSGIVLFARTPAARRSLARQWAGRTVVKRYRTLASGRPAGDELEIDVPIGPLPYPPLGSLHAACAAGKPASSRVTVVERFADAFLAEVTIATGRPHQIRIHLAAAGHPLVGDPLYGAGGVPRPGTRALPGDAGYLLHATALELDHPRDGRRLAIECEPPAGLRAATAARDQAGPDRPVYATPSRTTAHSTPVTALAINTRPRSG